MTISNNHTPKINLAFRLLMLSFSLWTAPSLPAFAAQETSAPAAVPQAATATASDEDKLTEEKIASKRAELAPLIENARKALEPAKAPVADVTPEAVPPEIVEQQKQLLQLLERIDSLLGQQNSAIKQAAALASNQTQLDEKMAQLKAKGPVEKPPYSYLLFDNLRDELQVEVDKATDVQAAIKLNQDNKDQAKKQYDDKEKARILAKEALDKASDPVQTAILTAKLRTALFDSRAAQEMIVLRDLEGQNQAASKAIYEKNLEFLRERVKWIGGKALFLPKDLKDQKDRLAEERANLEKLQKDADTKRETAEKLLQGAQERFAKAPESIALREEINARQYERDLYQDRVDLCARRLGWLKDREEIWQRRFDVVNRNAAIQQLEKWRSESQNSLDSLQSAERRRSSEMSNVRKDQVTLNEKIERFKDDADVTKFLKKQQDLYQQKINDINDNLSRIEGTRRLYNKLLSEIEQETKTWSFKEVWQYVWLKINAVLDYGKTFGEGEEGKNAFTVRKGVIALIYLIAGVTLARYLSRVLMGILLKRLGVHEGASNALQSLSYYFFLIIVFLLTLNAINIPMAAFTFLGGALAIGVGFGSQNILNNFISGLILLIERPIRAGDIIEYEGSCGSVVSIGARCTRIMMFDNIDLLIPNSKLLENKVVNLTLSDKIVRTGVKVGAAYGSDVRDVLRLMKKAVDEHGLILRKPEPFVTFSDFGDNALLFEVRFWVEMNVKTNRLIVESDVRHRIYNLFNDAGIAIAFPQRDIHLDTVRPLEVRWFSESAKTPAE
ncbi:MAG: mechanosensitive ion channel domain-containing protein [Candidatus Omnitrophota bacterium]